jgi:hypothetical protein
MPILTDSLEFALTALIGGGLGLLMVAIFYRPFRHGPTARIVHLLHAATLLLICGAFWAGALGFMADMRGQPWEVTYGLAIGFTGGAGWLWLRRWRRYRQYVRDLEASDASVNGAQRRTVPAGNAPGRTAVATASPKLAPRVPAWRLAIRCIDYALGVMFCTTALTGGAGISLTLRAAVARHFTGTAHLPALIGTHLVLALIGLAWSQLITGAALRAMRYALARDWRIARRWQYILLAVPFAWCLPISIAAPGILAGLLLNLATLWAGWRYTTDPPNTPLATLKSLRARHYTARPAH